MFDLFKKEKKSEKGFGDKEFLLQIICAVAICAKVSPRNLIETMKDSDAVGEYCKGMSKVMVEDIENKLERMKKMNKDKLEKIKEQIE